MGQEEGKRGRERVEGGQKNKIRRSVLVCFRGKQRNTQRKKANEVQSALDTIVCGVTGLENGITAT